MLDAAKKMLIWAAAVAIPLQGMPAQSCGCSDRSETVGADTCAHGAHEHGHSCCSTHGGEHSCCSTEHRQSGTCCCCCVKGHCDHQHCTCGINCPCRHGMQTPPATPPVEQRSLDKVLCSGLAYNSAAVSLPSAKPQQLSVTLSSFDAATGMDRCISLCRFML